MVDMMNVDNLIQARALLKAGRIEEVYAYIAAFGHRYSRLASGMDKCSVTRASLRKMVNPHSIGQNVKELAHA